jgi:hypothetical protein
MTALLSLAKFTTFVQRKDFGIKAALKSHGVFSKLCAGRETPLDSQWR